VLGLATLSIDIIVAGPGTQAGTEIFSQECADYNGPYTWPKDALFPCPNDPQSFIQCNEFKTTTENAFIQDCAPSDYNNPVTSRLYWSDNEKFCDWKENVTN
jgi:hypothetical protein